MGSGSAFNFDLNARKGPSGGEAKGDNGKTAKDGGVASESRRVFFVRYVCVRAIKVQRFCGVEKSQDMMSW